MKTGLEVVFEVCPAIEGRGRWCMQVLTDGIN